MTFSLTELLSFLKVSGFYAECLTKRMCLTAYIWTKSRFLGLSLGVHHIGKGQTISCHPLPPHTLSPLTPSHSSILTPSLHHTTVHLNLLDYGEEYTVTLPNAYARYFVALIHQTSPTPLPLCFPLSSSPPLPLPQIYSDLPLDGNGGQVSPGVCTNWILC